MALNNLIILKCSQDIAQSEVDLVQNICSLLVIDPFVVDKSKGEDIASKTHGYCFNSVYLCGHGSLDAFGGATAATCTNWNAVGTELATAMCLHGGSTVFCACCRGGLLTVAKTLLKTCQQIDFVCGPRCDIYPNVLALGFHALMYNIIFRRGDPVQAAKLASEATGHQFSIHDRQELADQGLI